MSYAPKSQKTLFKKALLPCLIAASITQVSNAAILEEVIITAQKRSQSSQDVGLSIAAVSGDEVERLDLKNVTSLASVVPNMTALDGSAGQPSFRIRGVGLNEFSAAFDAPVAIHLDEVFLWKPVMAEMGFFDVNRVEALMGPQGTVFGRNATAGAVNFYSNRPTDEFEAGIGLNYGRYERVIAKGHISGPLSDRLKGRLAVQIKDYAADEGPWKNLYDGKRIGELEQTQLRGMLEWSDDDTMILATYEMGDKEGHLPPYDNLFQDTPGAHPFNPDPNGGVLDTTVEIRNPYGRSTYNADNQQETDAEQWSASVRVEQETGLGQLTSITSYREYERENTEDSDNTPIRSINIEWNTKIESFSQELRLNGEKDNWTYLVGAYYEDDNLEAVELFDSRDFLAIPFGGIGYFGDDYELDTQSWAIFTNNEFALSDDLILIVGARYTEENVEIKGEGYAAMSDAAIGSFDRVGPAERVAVIGFDDDRKDDDFNVKLGLNYNVSKDVMVYASASTGFRSGGFDATIGGAALGNPLITFDPEDVTSFELGIKSTLLDDAMNLNVAIFSSEVEDYQDTVNAVGEAVPRRRNTGTLETEGVEVDLQWQATEYWMFKWGLGYTDAEVTDATGFLVDGFGFEGTIPANTPEWSTNLMVNYNKQASDNLILDILVSGQWQDERYLEPTNRPDHLVDSFSTLDVSVSLMSADEKWSVSLWGKNITDEEYLLYINDIPDFLLFLTINAEPATYGISFDYRF